MERYVKLNLEDGSYMYVLETRHREYLKALKGQVNPKKVASSLMRMFVTSDDAIKKLQENINVAHGIFRIKSLDMLTMLRKIINARIRKLRDIEKKKSKKSVKKTKKR